jgi:FAD/FMN-containing dehydrogenase
MMSDLLSELRSATGDRQCLSGDDIEPRYLADTMHVLSEGRPLAVLRPDSVAQVAAVLRLCNEAGVALVVQGGRTGLAGGATPQAGWVVLSLERLRGIEQIDAAAASMTVWAGTTLQEVQEAAWAAGFFYPVDLGGRGSCQIGGNIGTNAGGNRVIRYGMTRQQVLGLEVVLADGTVLSSLNKMLKNNAGYDLKQLFIGSEGTLGVVTRAVLRLQPQPRSTCTALCALADYAAVMRLLHHLRQSLSGSLSAFEMMWPDFYELISALPDRAPPLPWGHGAYVLVEALGAEQRPDQARFEAALQAALADGTVADAVIAQSDAQARALWAIRDGSGEFRRVFWPHVGYDISIPSGDLGAFTDACRAALQTRWPQARSLFFGHVGDANIHIAVQVGEFEQPEHALDELVYGLVRDWQGSISAEHGIGVLKRPYLGHSRTAAELALMTALKRTLDPRHILNPGKIFDIGLPGHSDK